MGFLGLIFWRLGTIKSTLFVIMQIATEESDLSKDTLNKIMKKAGEE